MSCGRRARIRFDACALRALSLAAAAFSVLVPGAAFADCNASFLTRVDQGLLASSALDEASGLAPGRRNPGVFWTHNDSGDLNRIFAVGANGEHLGAFTIAGVTNRDWEDIAAGPGPESGVNYLYIGEIGDNSAVHDTKYVYRIPEPAVDPARAPYDTTLAGAAAIAFQYPDGRRDAETLMVDPLTRDLYVVSKRETAVRVYRAAYPQPVGPAITLEHVATLPFTSIVSGDIAPSGLEILMKTYTQVLHWCREEGQTVAEALQAVPAVLPYTPEPQGEAIAWGAGGGDFFTVSEEPEGGPEAHLYRYPRAGTTGADDPRGDRGGAGGDGLPDAAIPFVIPNPALDDIAIRYVLLRPDHVLLTLHTAGGRSVRRLVDASQEAGEHTVRWDGRDDSGRPAAAGAYYCSLRTGDGSRRARLVRLR